MKKLAIITTHPIQYYAPVFALMHQRGNINIKVFYTWGESVANKYDPGFNKKIEWDIPLLEGYPYEWVKNTSKEPGSHHFNGAINPDLIRRILVFKPDAILVFGWAWQSHLKAIRYFKNKMPVYFRGDSTLLDEKPGLKAIARVFFLKWVYRHVSHVFYVGAANKQYYLKYGLKESQLSFAPHAIDNSRFAVCRKNEEELLKQKLVIKNREYIILFVGKLEEKKNPMLLLDAFLTMKMVDAHLLFVGSGPLENQLKAKAHGNSNIHFLGFQNQSQMPVVYQSCDIFCLPSRGPNETWGLAVNEAMACGKAVLVSDKVGCTTDLVRNNYNGLIFKSNDLSGLTLCLRELTLSKRLLDEYGENSRRIINDWNFGAIAAAIENKLINETH
jgi:glycosyltransferase involved in cell wall biosynthesis